MKTILHLLLGLALCGSAMAQTKTVTKTVSGNDLTESLNVPSGKTLTIESGATINAAAGSTITGFGSGSGLTNFASTLTGGTLTFAGTLTTGRTLTWRDVAGTVALTSDLSSYQPLDSDLTAIAALTTTTYGRSLLEGADAAAVRTLLSLGTAAVANTTSSEGSPSAVSLASHTHSLGGSYITGTLPITKGGTGLVDTPTNGQLLIGNTATNAWARATLTAGAGIGITNGNASITIAVTTVPVANGGTGITSFSSGIATFLGTASSSNLRNALTDETGTGVAVFATSPTLSAPTTNNLTITASALTYAGTTTIDLTGDGFQTVTLTGDITFATSNRAAGRSKTVRIIGDGSSRTLAFPSWKFIGAAAPSALASGKTAILTITAFGTADTDIIAAYAVEP